MLKKFYLLKGFQLPIPKQKARKRCTERTVPALWGVRVILAAVFETVSISQG